MSIKQAIDFRNNQGELVYRAEADVLRFSAARCFPMTGEEKELAALRRLVAHIQRAGGQLAAFRQGPFLDFLRFGEPVEQFIQHTPRGGALVDRGLERNADARPRAVLARLGESGSRWDKAGRADGKSCSKSGCKSWFK